MSAINFTKIHKLVLRYIVYKTLLHTYTNRHTDRQTIPST